MNKAISICCRTRTGFTLMEVLLAVTILSLVVTAVYTTFNAALTAWKRGSEASDIFQRQRIVMEALQELAESAVFSATKPDLYSVIATKNPGLGDSVSFVTASDAFLPPSEASAAGMRRVTISIEADQYGRTYLAIVNQTALQPDDDKDKSTATLQAHVISMDVSGFYVRYRSPSDGTWDDKWEDTNLLPSALEFTVVFGRPNDTVPPVVVTRAIDLPVADYIANGAGGSQQNTTNEVQRQNVPIPQ